MTKDIPTPKDLQRRFNRGCTEHRLLQDGDRILIAVSGGKDSLILCRLLAERARIFRPHIEVEAAHVVMDNIPYETDRSYLSDYCASLGIRLHILHSRFNEQTDERKTRCFLCSWHRRKTLFRFALEEGFNKLALGHHQDDILVTFLMNIIYEGNTGTIQPLMTLDHYKSPQGQPLTLIRPLCFVPERMIRDFASTISLTKQKVPCPYETTTRRTDITQLLAQIESLNPEARESIWHALSK